ncbi:MAG: thiamine phosphate synthase [Candidatus Eisenbacteria bacterium]|nr:thiamine phosphate synthase [Candidatus Eisenbacteria bacterium]
MSILKRRERLLEGHGLYLILTRPRLPHIELARAACERNVPVIQLREKELHDPELLALAREIAAVTRGTQTLFIVNDRPDIAAASEADGVHLGRDDTGYTQAREFLGPDAIVGLSIRTPREGESARRIGADYVGVGPVFPTATKPDALEPVGLEGLKAVAARVPDLPRVAIGGITPGNVHDVLAAGAQYAAVISAICHAADPVAAMDALLSARGPGGGGAPGLT